MNIREERLNRGIELKDAAREMGIPYHVLREAEKKERRPRSAEQAKAIADFYGVRVTDIWTVHGEPVTA